MSAHQFVEDFIKKDKVVIFSKSYCPYCNSAKQIFDQLGQKYAVLEIENRDDCDAIQDALKQITGERTVPRIFINGKCIGGCSDLKKLQSDQKLEPLLQN